MHDAVGSIRSYARYWAEPDPYKVSGEDLVTIFQNAGCKSVPELKDANNGGGIEIKKKSQAQYLTAAGNLDKLSAGDIAIIPKSNHFFLVIDNMWGWSGEPLIITIEGNTTGQKIKSNIRPLRYPLPTSGSMASTT